MLSLEELKFKAKMKKVKEKNSHFKVSDSPCEMLLWKS